MTSLRIHAHPALWHPVAALASYSIAQEIRRKIGGEHVAECVFRGVSPMGAMHWRDARGDVVDATVCPLGCRPTARGNPSG